MKLSTKLDNALNDQLNLELVSAYAYLGMAAHFEQTAFSGFAKWMELQSGEELKHAHKFYKYLAQRTGKIRLEVLPQPKGDFKSALHAFQTSLAHEQKVSGSTAALYELAREEKDYPTLSFLKWFLDEQ